MSGAHVLVNVDVVVEEDAGPWIEDQRAADRGYTSVSERRCAAGDDEVGLRADAAARSEQQYAAAAAP